MSDSLDKLSQATGLGRQTMLDIWEHVKANQARLDGCPGTALSRAHAFEDIAPDKKLGKKYRCRLCAGEIDARAYHWYAMGLEHGVMGPRS